MSWECFLVWVMATMNSSPAAKRTPKETAVADTDIAAADFDIPHEATESAEDASHTSDLSAEITQIAAAIFATEENSDIIAKAERKRLEDIASNTHTGISVEGGCRACDYQYELNGQTQAESAGGDVEDDVKEADVVEGGPLDQLSCIVM